jgi:predicted Zn-dependent protease with MMP-like domain
MTLQKFESLARTIWSEIPEQYKQGIDGLVIEENAHAHPEHQDFFTLGECVTEAYPSDFGGPETIRSFVVLYYGSFAAVAQEDPDFDWEDEIDETLLHELQHHLEHLAADDKLEDFDYAVQENFRRVEGQPFDPLFYHAGVQISADCFRVEADVFLEIESKRPEGFVHEFSWAARQYRAAVPASEADILYVVLDQEMRDVPGDFCIVRVRRRGMLGTLRAALGSRRYTMEEVKVSAEQL